MAQGVGAVSTAEDALRLEGGRAAHDAAKVGVAEGQALQGARTLQNSISACQVPCRSENAPACITQITWRS